MVFIIISINLIKSGLTQKENTAFHYNILISKMKILILTFQRPNFLISNNILYRIMININFIDYF